MTSTDATITLPPLTYDQARIVMSAVNLFATLFAKAANVGGPGSPVFQFVDNSTSNVRLLEVIPVPGADDLYRYAPITGDDYDRLLDALNFFADGLIWLAEYTTVATEQEAVDSLTHKIRQARPGSQEATR